MSTQGHLRFFLRWRSFLFNNQEEEFPFLLSIYTFFLSVSFHTIIAFAQTSKQVIRLNKRISSCFISFHHYIFIDKMPLHTSAVHSHDEPQHFARFSSRRSVVHSTKGIVSCTQPLASQCGLEVLRKGGNCADAAVAVAAGLNLTEPGSTGIGGDMFCLFYEAKTKKVHALNGSGRAGKNCTLDVIRQDLGLKHGESGTIPMSSVHAVTVPGAAAGWVDTVERFGSGKVTMEEILAPAIELGEQGFPVSELMGYSVSRSSLALLWC